MISFENTEIAFKNRSTFELKRAYWLFLFMSKASLVKIGKVLILSALRIKFPVSFILKPTLFNHFCGGETLLEAAQTVKKLKPFHIHSILDYSVEGKENEESIQAALNETIETIKNAAWNPEIPFTVFKPSAFASRDLLEKASNNICLNDFEKQELQKFKDRINLLCKTAFDADIPVMIDAEHSYYQQIIDDVCEAMMRKYNHSKAIVFNTLQMYRTDRFEFLEDLLQKAREQNYFLGIKFVRGAYMEKERERAIKLGYSSPIWPDKDATDKCLNDALQFSIKNIDKITIFNGTHNEQSCLYLTQLMVENNIPKHDKRIWFSQLYGMSDNISFNLANEGYNVAKYIPYGPLKHVIPYLIRRAEENTSVKGQTSRELKLINNELIQRKQNGY
jgi:proline dehydrogenase